MIINFIKNLFTKDPGSALLDARAMKDKRRWSRIKLHKQFVNEIMEFVVYWFQLGCFFYIALHVILMAHAGDSEKSINWALIALIIKPWGKEIKA